MKTNLYIYLMSFLLIGMISCNKEVITEEEPITIIDPPSEIDYPVARGVVLDDEGILSEAQVLVYQEGELKGETTSNEEGEFTTIDIVTTPGKDLVLEFKKDEYITGYRKRSEDALKSSSLKVQLINEEDGYGDSSIWDPFDDHVSLSGYIKTFQGEPSRARVIVTYEIGTTSYAGSTLTDSDGYYELLVGEAVDINVSIFSDTICFDYLTEQEVTIFTSLQAEIMGPFNEDVVLDDYYNAYVTARDFSISGFVQNCDGLNAPFTSVTVNIDDHQGYDYVYVYNNEEEGTFSFDENDCISIPYSVTVVGIDELGNSSSDTLMIEVTEAIFSQDDIILVACNPLISDYSTATMVVDGIEYNFNQINTRLENGSLISDEITLDFGIFTIPNVELGTNEIHSLEMGNWGTAAYFKAVNDVMIAEVTSLTSDAATVVISGSFSDTNSDIVQGTCTLNLTF